MSPTSTLPAAAFYRLPEVLHIFKISRSAWYAGIKAGRFPKPVKLGPRTAAYRVEDIAALIARLGTQEEEV